MKKAIIGCLSLPAFVAVVVLIFIGSALVTARIPGKHTPNAQASSSNVKGAVVYHDIYLLTGLLHTDIALPSNEELRRRFSFLSETKLLLSHPKLEYLSFGWGSKAFYTTAGEYSDIKPSAVFTAMIGDRSVMRIVALGKLQASQTVVKIRLNTRQLIRLASFIEKSFSRTNDGKRNYMAGVHLEPNDAFYAAVGGFNIFKPCNQWVNMALRSADIKLGIWTPTTQSLVQSLRYFSGSNVQP